jgi:hypothetical protein
MPASRNRKKKKNNFPKGKSVSTSVIQHPIKKGIAPDPIKMKYFEAQFPFQEDSTFEERLNDLRETGRKAVEEFPAKFHALKNWFKNYDQLYLLSFSFYYFMMSKAGYDEEAVTGELQFPPYYQELLQAFALTLPRNGEPRPITHEVEKFRNDFKEANELNRLKHFNFPDSVKTSDDMYRHQLRTEMMLHTTAVRNWSYEHKMNRVTLDLARGVKKVFMEKHGFDPEVFLKVIYRMAEEVQQRVNGHLQKIANIVRQSNYSAIIEAYENNFPVEKMPKNNHKFIWEKVGRDLMQLRAMFMSHSDLFLPELLIFSFEYMELYSEGSIKADQFRDIMKKLSYDFGDLANHVEDHFLMGNPVHEKPFIAIEDIGVYSSLWATMAHLSLGLLEKFCAEDETLREKYNGVRAEYLEDQLEVLCKQSFPMAKVYAGSKWPGKDGKLYENDILIVIDNFAIVIEAKSGQVSPPAKRAAPSRLFETLQGLVEEPSVQALRFIEYLKENPVELSLSAKKGPDNRFDAGSLKYFIPLGVTLTHLGMLGANLKLLIKAGVTQKPIEELAPSMSLTDLEVVFDLLPLVAEKVHYLQRRREIEVNINYMGDELDLLAWYFDKGFNFSPDEDKFGFFQIVLKSKELDNYIIGSANGEDVKKPELKKTQWWKDILQRIEERKFQTWLESSYVLLNIPFDAQKIFEKQVAKQKKDMLTGKAEHLHNWILMGSAEENRRFMVAGYNFHDRLADERKNMMGDILEDERTSGAKGKIVIAINIDKDHYPYSSLGSWLASELFDNRFLKMVNISE